MSTRKVDLRVGDILGLKPSIERWLITGSEIKNRAPVWTIHRLYDKYSDGFIYKSNCSNVVFIRHITLSETAKLRINNKISANDYNNILLEELK